VYFQADLRAEVNSLQTRFEGLDLPSYSSGPVMVSSSPDPVLQESMSALQRKLADQGMQLNFSPRNRAYTSCACHRLLLFRRHARLFLPLSYWFFRL
jgi:hypothetical protein